MSRQSHPTLPSPGDLYKLRVPCCALTQTADLVQPSYVRTLSPTLCFLTPVNNVISPKQETTFTDIQNSQQNCCTYVFMYVCIYVCNVCMHACMSVRMHVCLLVCLYVCMYVCRDGIFESSNPRIPRILNNIRDSETRIFALFSSFESFES
jgi:hypothetical protein